MDPVADAVVQGVSSRLLGDCQPLSVKALNARQFEREANHSPVPLTVWAVSIEDIKKALVDKPVIDPATKLLKKYHDFLNIFSRYESDKLPPYRPHNHHIELLPGIKPPKGKLYSMSRDELLVLQKYIKAVSYTHLTLPTIYSV